MLKFLCKYIGHTADLHKSKKDREAGTITVTCNRCKEKRVMNFSDFTKSATNGALYVKR